MISPVDQHFMRSALSIARRGIGNTAPNPCVGCVIVKDGTIIARARTADSGRPHAEMIALNACGENVRGATAYVTLEPCAHHGQTPPCAQSLIDAGVSRVVIGVTDCDPRVSGKGAEMLERAGIEVVTGALEAECRALNAGFFSKVLKNRPYVTLKSACSLDGKTATASGESQWITGEAARAHGHMLRAEHDAILVGIGTVLADNPSLTVRGLVQKKVMTRIVLDSALKIPLDCDLVNKSVDEPVWIFFDPDHSDIEKKQTLSESAHIKLIPLPPKNLGSVLAELASEGITRLLVEGGATVHGSFMTSMLYDALYAYRAPIILGGNGKSAFPELGVRSLSDAHDLILEKTRSLGKDSLEIYKVKM